ncbi:hypothetical protein Scep_026397 [Stephania cephalantha]|uniref:Uncharacterized protein n=1 Tax=Stephania cephalantha TaxID=152367 RepID=A0AAP0ESB9_9MAGN
MVFFGFNAAISVRISNDLGSGRSRAAKFAILDFFFPTPLTFLIIVSWNKTLFQFVAP